MLVNQREKRRSFCKPWEGMFLLDVWQSQKAGIAHHAGTASWPSHSRM